MGKPFYFKVEGAFCSEAELVIQHIQPLVELVAYLREVGDFGESQFFVK